jgi:hypothetical protein
MSILEFNWTSTLVLPRIKWNQETFHSLTLSQASHLITPQTPHCIPRLYLKRQGKSQVSKLPPPISFLTPPKQQQPKPSHFLFFLQLVIQETKPSMQVLSPSNSCTKSHMQWSQSLLETSKSWEDKWGMSTPSLDLSLEVKYLCPSHCMLWLPNRLISYCSNSWGKNQFNQFLPFSPFLDLNLKNSNPQSLLFWVMHASVFPSWVAGLIGTNQRRKVGVEAPSNRADSVKNRGARLAS